MKKKKHGCKLPRVPYFYIIEYVPPKAALKNKDVKLHKQQKYCGIQYSKHCNPANLLKNNKQGYWTSSRDIHKRIKLFGLRCLRILEIKTEFDGMNVCEYEEQFQIEHDCARSDEWLNKRNGNHKFVTTEESIRRAKETKHRFEATCSVCGEVVRSRPAYTSAHEQNCKMNPSHPKYQKIIELQNLVKKYANECIDGVYTCVCNYKTSSVKKYNIHVVKCIDHPDNENYCEKDNDGLYTCTTCNKRTSKKKTYYYYHGINCTSTPIDPNFVCKHVQQDIIKQEKADNIAHLLIDDKYHCPCGMTTKRIDKMFNHFNKCIGNPSHENHMPVVGKYTFRCPVCDHIGNGSRYMSYFHGIYCSKNKVKPKKNFVFNFICLCGSKFTNKKLYETHYDTCITNPKHINHKIPNGNGKYDCEHCGKSILSLSRYVNRHGIYCTQPVYKERKCEVDRDLRKSLIESYQHLLNKDGHFECECGFTYPKALKRFRIHRETCIINPEHPNHKLPNEYGYYVCDTCGQWILGKSIYTLKHGVNCKCKSKPYGYNVLKIKKSLGIIDS